MAGRLTGGRWQVAAHEFAVRVTAADVPGLLEKSVTVEPGTRAVLVRDGVLGSEDDLELPPGTYTLQSFRERFGLVPSQQATVVLARMEDVGLDFALEDVATAELVPVGLSLQIGVQLADLVGFLHNFMGPRNEVTQDELADALGPLVERSVRETVGRSPIDEVRGPGFPRRLVDSIDATLQTSFARYGLNFVDVTLAHVRQEGLDAADRLIGEAAVTEQRLETEEAVGEIERKRRLRMVRARDEERELAILAARAETAGLESKLAARIERIELQGRIRKTLDAERLGKLADEQDLKDELLRIDERRLLRKEELDAIVAGVGERRADREESARHLRDTLAVQRRRELDELRSEVEHAERLRVLDHEMALADRVATKENAEWRRELERERADAEHRRDERRREFDEEWSLNTTANANQRAEDWEDLLDERRRDEVEGELAVRRAERTRRIALIEREVDVQKSNDQLDRLARVKELNLAADRQRAEIEEGRADRSHERDLRRIDTLGGLSGDALIATANTENAALLADVRKQEAVSRAEVESRALYERLNETERSRADAVADAYREAMRAQSPPSTAAPPVGPAAPPPDAGWYVSEAGTPRGPMSLDELKRELAMGRVTRTTFVWRAGREWSAAGEVPELAGPAVPPPPDSTRT